MDKLNRVVLGASAKTVSPAGYTLGGGHSPISRSLGLAVDNVLEFEMVDVDGNLVKSTESLTEITYENGTTSSSSNTDLFWALRGGGGGTFGIVSTFTFKLHQPPTQVVTFYCGYVLTYNGLVIGKNMINIFTGLLKNLPSEWGGYLILRGVKVDSTMFGPITFHLNHYGTMSDEHKKYLEPIYSICTEHSFTEYDSFLEYEQTVTDEEFTWMYTFNTLMSVDDFTDNWVDFVTDQMGNPPSGSMFGCTGTLIGGECRFVYIKNE